MINPKCKVYYQMSTLKMFLTVCLSVDVAHLAVELVELSQSHHLTWPFETGPCVGDMRMSLKHCTLLSAETAGRNLRHTKRRVER